MSTVGAVVVEIWVRKGRGSKRDPDLSPPSGCDPVICPPSTSNPGLRPPSKGDPGLHPPWPWPAPAVHGRPWSPPAVRPPVTLASARRPSVTLTCARRPRVTLVSTGRRAASGLCSTLPRPCCNTPASYTSLHGGLRYLRGAYSCVHHYTTGPAGDVPAKGNPGSGRHPTERPPHAQGTAGNPDRTSA